jgi:hypothetical protein
VGGGWAGAVAQRRARPPEAWGVPVAPAVYLKSAGARAERPAGPRRCPPMSKTVWAVLRGDGMPGQLLSQRALHGYEGSRCWCRVELPLISGKGRRFPWQAVTEMSSRVAWERPSMSGRMVGAEQVSACAPHALCWHSRHHLQRRKHLFGRCTLAGVGLCHIYMIVEGPRQSEDHY